MDIYPASAQRAALLKLMPALGCSDTALRRDECGDPRIEGKACPHTPASSAGAQIAARAAFADRRRNPTNKEQPK
jgi:hypothetical protein